MNYHQSTSPVAAVFDRRLNIFSAVIDRRYRTASLCVETIDGAALA
jgi:hypothetical protein